MKLFNAKVCGVTVGTPLNTELVFDSEGYAVCSPEVASVMAELPGYQVIDDEKAEALPQEEAIAGIVEADIAPVGPPASVADETGDMPPEDYNGRLEWAKARGYEPSPSRPRKDIVDAWINDYLNEG